MKSSPTNGECWDSILDLKEDLLTRGVVRYNFIVLCNIVIECGALCILSFIPCIMPPVNDSCRTLCVPCIGSFNKKHVLTLEDIETHTVTRDEVRELQNQNIN